jgi:hypothetical protein
MSVGGGGGSAAASQDQLQLPPGFRFHPTDEELVKHYLCRRCAGLPIAVPIIADMPECGCPLCPVEHETADQPVFGPMLLGLCWCRPVPQFLGS